MGGGSWTGLWADVTVKPPQPHISLEVEPLPQVKIEQVFGQEEALEELSGQFSLAWQSLKHVRSSSHSHQNSSLIFVSAF